MLNEMLRQLDRLIIKYSDDTWNSKSSANCLVELLMEHAFLLQSKLYAVKSGTRVLRDNDFLGPKTRKARAARIAQRDGKK